MLQLIDELETVPGVIGACLYSAHSDQQENNLPGIFKPDRLIIIGRQLQELLAVGRLSFNDLTDLTLNYEDSVVLARQIRQELLLFVVCEPGFNQSLLSMSFKLLQDELNAGSKDGEVLPGMAAPANMRAETAAEKSPQVEDLTELFDALREQLVKILGPMAGIIFNEVLEAWQQQGAVARSRVGELITQIEVEIADPEKIERFRKLIEPDLQAFQSR